MRVWAPLVVVLWANEAPLRVPFSLFLVADEARLLCLAVPRPPWALPRCIALPCSCDSRDAEASVSYP